MLRQNEDCLEIQSAFIKACLDTCLHNKTLLVALIFIRCSWNVCMRVCVSAHACMCMCNFESTLDTTSNIRIDGILIINSLQFLSNFFVLIQNDQEKEYFFKKSNVSFVGLLLFLSLLCLRHFLSLYVCTVPLLIARRQAKYEHSTCTFHVNSLRISSDDGTWCVLHCNIHHGTHKYNLQAIMMRCA